MPTHQQNDKAGCQPDNRPDGRCENKILHRLFFLRRGAGKTSKIGLPLQKRHCGQKAVLPKKKGEGEKRQREKKKNEKRRGQIPAAEATNRTEQAEPTGVERERLSALLPDLEKKSDPWKA